MLRELARELRFRPYEKPEAIAELDDWLATVLDALQGDVLGGEDLKAVALVARVHVTSWARQVGEVAVPRALSPLEASPSGLLA